MPRIMFNYNVRVQAVLFRTDGSEKLEGEPVKFSTIEQAIDYCRTNPPCIPLPVPKCIDYIIEICLQDVALERLDPFTWKKLAKEVTWQ